MAWVQMPYRLPMFVLAGQVIGQPILFALEVLYFRLEETPEVLAQSVEQLQQTCTSWRHT